MIPDSIDEIRAIKRKLSDACGNDIGRIDQEMGNNGMDTKARVRSIGLV